ncbi:MAG TPA: hypothetical protein VGE07_07375 [Herpetosiphonaceae bacterium]
MSDPQPERIPIEQDQHDIVFVSDLHLSNGYSRASGRYDPREDFFYDGEFHRFLQYLIGQGKERRRPQRLVLLGDLFDFLQVDNRPFDKHGLPEPSSPAYADQKVRDFKEKKDPFLGLSTSPSATVWRLERIARGHNEWFRALGEFLQADGRNRIDVIVGNHDIELTWPAAQERFKGLIEESVEAPGIGAGLHFYPWFLYEPGLFYAEHGHQYDDLNSFATQMAPTLPDNQELIELPLGSFFVRYVFNKIEARDAFSDNVRPMTRYVAWALRNHPISGLLTLFYQGQMLVKVLRKASHLSDDEHKARLERYHREVVAPYAAQAGAGLSAEQLIAIDNLAEIPSMNSRWRQARQVVLDPLLPLLWVLAPLMLMFRALRQVRRTARAAMAFLAGFAGLLYRERATFRPPSEPESHLRDAAREIDKILRQNGGAGARFYIFGHTHKTEVYPLGAENEEPRYLNTGTWTPIIDPDAQLLRGVTQFNFVQILRNDNGYQLAELLYWNDGAGRPQLVPLLEP